MNPFYDPLGGLREKEPPPPPPPPAATVTEGFICPECMKKFATMTELMRHVDSKHPVDSGSGAGGLDDSVISQSKPSRKSNGFLSKLLKKNKSEDSLDSLLRCHTDGVDVVENREDSMILPSTAITDGVAVGFSDEDEDDEEDEEVELRIRSSPADQPQVIGSRRSHFGLFKQFREKRIERNELLTNKMIIRLDRILRDYPEMDDFYKRRTHEQKVVDWIPANLVANCPLCTGKFGFLNHTGLKHHCRLCGCVMCFRCSVFYPMERAARLVGNAPPPARILDTKRPELSFTSVGKVLSFLSFELNPELDPDHWNELRLCVDCDWLMRIRGGKMMMVMTDDDDGGQSGQLSLKNYFDEIVELKLDIQKTVDVFTKMARSLRRGEQDYKLVDANGLLMECTAKLSRLNLISEKVAKLKVLEVVQAEDGGGVSSCMQAKIQANIRREVLNWCQRTSVRLPSVPTVEEYERLKVRHEERIQRRIRKEKDILLREQEVVLANKRKSGAVLPSDVGALRGSESGQQRGPEKNEVTISHEDGFSCSATDYHRKMINNNREDVDPLTQQIGLMQHYIVEARKAKRFDEVASLETHLKELEIERYFVEQQQQEEEDELKVEVDRIEDMKVVQKVQVDKKAPEVEYPMELDPFEEVPRDVDDLHPFEVVNRRESGNSLPVRVRNPFDVPVPENRLIASASAHSPSLRGNPFDQSLMMMILSSGGCGGNPFHNQGTVPVVSVQQPVIHQSVEHHHPLVNHNLNPFAVPAEPPSTNGQHLNPFGEVSHSDNEASVEDEELKKLVVDDGDEPLVDWLGEPVIQCRRIHTTSKTTTKWDTNSYSNGSTIGIGSGTSGSSVTTLEHHHHQNRVDYDGEEDHLRGQYGVLDRFNVLNGKKKNNRQSVPNNFRQSSSSSVDSLLDHSSSGHVMIKRPPRPRNPGPEQQEEAFAQAEMMKHQSSGSSLGTVDDVPLIGRAISDVMFDAFAEVRAATPTNNAPNSNEQPSNSKDDDYPTEFDPFA